MRTRRRKDPAPAPRPSVEWNPPPDPSVTTIRRVSVPTPDLMVIENLEEISSLDFAGHFVKLAPRLPASQRETFDGAALKRDLLREGARAVVLAPVFVPDSRKAAPAAIAKASTPRQAAEAWFADQTAAAPEDCATALGLVFGFMDSEGL